MSLVGTRPILQDELRQYELHHRARIAIKPGITGMWQVSGRSDITDFEEVVRLDTETKLARISQLSKENPDMVFTSLGHLINKEMLKSCHAQMDGTKAVGIDGITKEEYGRRLEENISALIERLKKKSYKPKPARLVEIPKDNGKMRPLSIYCYEDNGRYS